MAVNFDNNFLAGRNQFKTDEDKANLWSSQMFAGGVFELQPLNSLMPLPAERLQATRSAIPGLNKDGLRCREQSLATACGNAFYILPPSKGFVTILDPVDRVGNDGGVL